MTLPNFLIVGSARSGTTAFYEYLSQHPQVFMSEPKEPNFLAFEGRTLAFTGPGDEESINRTSVTRREDYEALFADTGDARAIGEASIAYLYHPESIEGIKRHVPDVRLLIMLRNPAERAFSAWGLQTARMFETLPFEQALEAEAQRIRAGWHHIWHYRQMGYYADQLARYFAAFPRDQIRVWLYDDFARDRGAVLADAYRFIGVDPDFEPKSAARPVMSGTPRNVALQRTLMTAWRFRVALQRLVPRGVRTSLWRRLNQANLERVSMPVETRRMLTEGYREDVGRLSELLGRDLTAWTRA